MVKKLYFISFLVIFIDRIFKWFFSNNEFGIFRYSLNEGAAFGILQGWNNFLVAFGVIVVGVILYYRNDKKLELGLGFLLGGVVSNLIDRIVFNGVIDYIHIDFFNNIFNLADVANVIGVGILIYHFWKE